MPINISATTPGISLGLARYAGEGAKQQALFSQAMAQSQQDMQKTQLMDDIANRALQRASQRQQFTASYDLQKQGLQLQAAAADRAAQSLQDQQTRTQLTVRGMETRDKAAADKASQRLDAINQWKSLEGTMPNDEFVRGLVATTQGRTPVAPRTATAAEKTASEYQEWQMARGNELLQLKKIEAQQEAAEKAAAPFYEEDKEVIKETIDASLSGFAPKRGWYSGGSTLSPGKLLGRQGTKVERRREFAEVASNIIQAFPVSNTYQASELRTLLIEKAASYGFEPGEGGGKNYDWLIPAIPILSQPRGGNIKSIPEAQKTTKEGLQQATKFAAGIL